MAKCPDCKTAIPESIPLKGDLTYTCECGKTLDGTALRVISGFPEPESDKPKRAKRTKGTK